MALGPRYHVGAQLSSRQHSTWPRAGAPRGGPGTSASCSSTDRLTEAQDRAPGPLCTSNVRPWCVGTSGDPGQSPAPLGAQSDGSHAAQPGLSGCPAIPTPRTSSRSKAALSGMNSVSRSGASLQGQRRWMDRPLLQGASLQPQARPPPKGEGEAEATRSAVRSWGGAGGEATGRKGARSAVSPALAWQDAGA